MEKSEEKTGFLLSTVAGLVFLALYLYFRIMAENEFPESGNALWAGITFIPMIFCFVIAFIFLLLEKIK